MSDTNICLKESKLDYQIGEYSNYLVSGSEDLP
jgi:hypothetical protein